MYENDLVSVIIPVFNASKFLEETIQSAVNQTYKNIEIVLVDDYSTDDSAEIIKSLQKEYSNIIYFKQDFNQGAAVARNTALNIAKGRYVAFLDSDDVWLPRKIECQLNLLKNKKSVFSYTAIDMIDEYGKIVKSKRSVIEKIDLQFLLRNTMIATSTVILDRKTIGSFSMPNIRSGQDYATWLMKLNKKIIAYGINESLVHYRIRKGSLSSNKWKSVCQVWNIQRRLGIQRFQVGINTLFFVSNAFKKYFF